MTTEDVRAKFCERQPVGHFSAVVLLTNPDEWNRFMRFMKHSDKNGMGFMAADGPASPL